MYECIYVYVSIEIQKGFEMVYPVRDFWQSSSCSMRWGRSVFIRSDPQQHSTQFGTCQMGVKYFRTENGSSQGRNLALTGLCVPSSLEVREERLHQVRPAAALHTIRHLSGPEGKLK